MELRRQGLWTYARSYSAIIGAALCLAAGIAMASPAAGTKRIRLWSSAFKNGAAIPARYTCLGENRPPPLAWSGVPANAKSLVLIMDDPDAPSGTWTHWIIYGLSPKINALAGKNKSLAAHIRQGRNSFGDVGYGGPCPPRGPAHHYHFQIYALNIKNLTGAGTSEPALLRLMRGHILARGELLGTFRRP